MKQFRRSYCMVLFLREPESSELGFRLSSGKPVTRRPPHRSRRAVLPHRALQPNTLSIAHRKVGQSILRNWLLMPCLAPAAPSKPNHAGLTQSKGRLSLLA
jgi:hypothetical protein